MNQSKEVDEYAERAQRIRRTIELRLQGRTYTEICKTLGYDNSDQVREEIKQFLNRLAEDAYMDHELEKKDED